MLLLPDIFQFIVDAVPGLKNGGTGKFKYVVADIVVAVNPPPIFVFPVIVKSPFTVKPVTVLIVAVKLDSP